MTKTLELFVDMLPVNLWIETMGSVIFDMRSPFLGRHTIHIMRLMMNLSSSSFHLYNPTLGECSYILGTSSIILSIKKYYKKYRWNNKMQRTTTKNDTFIDRKQCSLSSLRGKPQEKYFSCLLLLFILILSSK
jgi:hypothetical protein